MSTLLKISTIEILRIYRLVRLASHFRNSIFVCEVISSSRTTSPTVSTPFTVQKYLSSYSSLGEFIFSLYIYSIGNYHWSGLGPTTATVIRDKLVYTPWHIIFSICIPPIEKFRQFSILYIVLRQSRYYKILIFLFILILLLIVISLFFFLIEIVNIIACNVFILLKFFFILG